MIQTFADEQNVFIFNSDTTEFCAVLITGMGISQYAYGFIVRWGQSDCWLSSHLAVPPWVSGSLLPTTAYSAFPLLWSCTRHFIKKQPCASVGPCGRYAATFHRCPTTIGCEHATCTLHNTLWTQEYTPKPIGG